MGEKTEISWCTHTFNAWWGCTEVEDSPACDGVDHKAITGAIRW